MTSKNVNVSGPSFPIAGFAFLILLVLKVGPESWDTPVQDWSWWWVTAPLWISAILVFVFVFIALFVAVVSDK